MNNIQLFAQSQGATGYASNIGLGTYMQLDLYSDEPIKITSSISSLEDPQLVTSSFSRSFRIPNTPNNSFFMKAVFNVNSSSFDATKKSLSYIYINGVNYQSGNIRLQSVIRNDKDKKIEYEIIFFGGISTFSSITSPKLLSELDISELTHEVSYSNYKLSWDRKLKNGNIVYPLVEWGYTYGKNGDQNIPEQSTLSHYSSAIDSNSKKGFTNILNPLSLRQFKPFIKVKYLWDKVFQDSGFTYESEFINGSTAGTLFDSLYLVSTDKDTAGPLNTTLYFKGKIDSNPGPFNGQAYPFRNINSTVYEFDLISTNFIDTGRNFKGGYNGKIGYLGNPTSYYVSSYPGNYKVLITSLKGRAQMSSPWPRTVQIQVKKDSGGIITYYNKTGYIQGNNNPIFSNLSPIDIDFNFIIPMVKDDILTFKIIVSSSFFTTFGITAGEITVELNQPLNPGGYLPSQYKQIDFIKSINDKFRLIWEIDKENPKNIKIEPWITWVKKGNKKDWSDKLNEDKDISVTPLFYEYKRQINFKDSEDTDLYNDIYTKSTKQIFGQLNLDSNIEIITDKLEFKSLFSPFIIAPIGNSDNFLIPHLCRDSETERQSMEVKPKLCFYNGIVKSPETWFLVDDNASIPAIYSQNEYPLVSPFFKNFVQGTGGYPDLFIEENTFSLYWTEVNQFWNSLIVGFDGRTNKNTFTDYWQNWTETIYDPYSRKMVATFALDSKDLLDLNFNDKIWIKDAWWMPTLIKDFILGTKQNVLVELIKLDRQGISIIGEPSLNLFKFDGFCFGETKEQACCCLGPVGNLSLWFSDPLQLTGNVYLDENALNIPNTGYYSDGINYYFIDSLGNIIIKGDCPLPCLPLTLFPYDNICYGDTLCEACCCFVGTTNIWGDTIDFNLATKIYGGPAGGSLIPGRWYKNGSTVVQVGPDGTTIIQYGTCDFCNCDPLSPEGFVLGGWYEGGDTSGTQKACCIQGTTGNLAITSYYSESLTFYGATGIYTTTSPDYPFGTTGQGYTGAVALSDGKYVKKVQDGIVLTTGDCTYAESCIARTSLPDFWAYNSSGTDITIDFNYLTSYDGINDFYIGSSSATGSSFSENHQYFYDPLSTVKVTANVPTISPGNLYYEAIYDGVTGPTGTIPTPGSLTTTPVLAGTGSWTFNFYWTL